MATGVRLRERINIPLVCIVLSLLCQTASLGFGKQAALTLTAFSAQGFATNPYYMASLICLGLQAVVWQVALRAYPLSFAYFFMSGIFVNIMLMSFFIFHEPISYQNLAGAVLIVAGIIVLKWDEPDKTNA